MKSNILSMVTCVWLLTSIVFSPANVAVGAGLWEIEPLGKYGQGNSIALNALGLPHISSSGPGLRHSYYDGSAWHTETLADVGGRTDIAVDNAGGIHISYMGSGLEYAYHDGNQWTTESVPQGGIASLAVDPNGRPHMASWGLDSNLWYVSRSGNGWNSQIVDSGSFGDASLAFDSVGNPHISYMYDSGTDRQLRYASYDGSNWNHTTLGFGFIHETNLLLDSQGRPHITYLESKPGLGNPNDLRYVTSDGVSWSDTRIADEVYGSETGLALDQLDRPHVTFSECLDYDAHPDQGDLRYGFLDGGVWQIETVEASDTGGLALTTRFAGAYTDLALDNFDRPHISYTYPGDGPGPNFFRYATIPEPATLGLFGVGGLLLISRRHLC